MGSVVGMKTDLQICEETLASYEQAGFPEAWQRNLLAKRRLLLKKMAKEGGR